jgi:hypothetical protein
MKHHRSAPRLKSLAILLALSVLTVSPALAQRGGLPSDLKSAPDVRPRSAEITAFVSAQVTQLGNDKDPAAQQRARDLLIREGAPGGVQPSGSFLASYAAALNTALLPVAKSPNARTRLNAAIVVQRVAKTTSSANLEPVTAAFAQDACAGVALWGMRAAQYILPVEAASGTGGKLSAAILAGAKKHADEGDVLEEAYKAITLISSKNVTATSAPVVTGDVLALLQFRIDQYVKKTPPKPDLDNRAVTYLTLSRVLDAKDAASVKRRPVILQAISNLAGVVAQHAAARQDQARRPYLDVLKNVGSALQAIAGNDEKMKAAGKAMMDLQTSMPDGEFTDRANAAAEALKVQVPGLTPAPAINPGAAEEAKEVVVVDEAGHAATKPADEVPAPSTDTPAPAPKTPTTPPAPKATPPAKTGTPPAAKPGGTGGGTGGGTAPPAKK